MALILILFIFLRPLYRNLSQAGAVVRERQNLEIAEMSRSSAQATGAQEALPGAAAGGLLTASSGADSRVDTIRGLVEEDPNRVAEVVKAWVGDNE